MRRQRKNRLQLACHGLVALCAAACSTINTRPELHVLVDKRSGEAIRVYRDGIQREAGSPSQADSEARLRLTPEYYGRVLVEVEGPIDAEHVSDRTEAGRLVDFPVPAPRWIFPLDLGVEAFRHLSGSFAAPTHRIQLPRATAVQAPLDDASVRRSVEATRASAVRR